MNELVKVKPLEWTRSIEGRRVFYRADGYHIEEWFGTDSFSFETVRGADEEAIYSGDDLPSAETAAQADYTARILAALDLTGVEALRLREENASLAMFQCVPGYGDEYGNSRCAVQDDNARLRADLVVAREALELYSCEDGCNDCAEDARDRVGCGWTARAAIAASLQDPVAVHANMLRGTIAKPSWEQIKHLYPVEMKATVAAAYEAAASIDPAIFDHPSVYMGGPSRQAMKTAEAVAKNIRAMTTADAAAALDRIKTEAVRGALSDFAKADWFWRDLDPDDSGDTPDEAINAGMVGRFTVCLIRSAFTGPDRFCFISPVLDPESDDEECLCFRTEDEAIAAVEERLATLKATGEAGNG